MLPTTLGVLVPSARSEDDHAAIHRAFDAAWARARAAHPRLRIDEAAFARHVSRHRADDLRSTLEKAHVEDLYLALGCGLGDAAALTEFELAHLAKVPAFVAHLGLDRAAIDELLQGLRDRLLAPRADGAKILHYGGQGALGGWLRIAAVRLALTQRASGARPRGDDDDAALATASARPDPELLLAREHASQAFKRAFGEALAALSADERTVLRMHYVDGLTIDQIGVAYAVHRATAARWIASGRERIATHTRKRLRAELKLDAQDLESVLRLVDSRLDLSLHRVFGGPSVADGVE